MKKAFLALLFTLPTLVHAQSNGPTAMKKVFDGIERNYLLYTPQNISKNAPLVMVFHGYSGTAAYAHSYFNMERLADKNGFVLVYPEGTIDQQNNHFWQVGYQGHKTLKIDDVSFIVKLAESLQNEYQLNSANTFIVGFSNGGDLCNKLICERPDFFKAAAPIISCMMEDVYDKCRNVTGVPTFMLNGTNDNITYWAGDMENKQGYGSYHSTTTMLNFRVEQNEAELSSSNTIKGDKDDKTSITVNKYHSKSNKNQVWMYQVNNGGHGHPDYLNLEDHVWQFFSMYLD
ncbi:CE1 family esterase [Ekhidna sp.]